MKEEIFVEKKIGFRRKSRWNHSFKSTSIRFYHRLDGIKTDWHSIYANNVENSFDFMTDADHVLFNKFIETRAFLLNGGIWDAQDGAVHHHHHTLFIIYFSLHSQFEANTRCMESEPRRQVMVLISIIAYSLQRGNFTEF